MSRNHSAHPDTPFALGYGTNGFTDHTLADALTVLDTYGYRALALTLGHPHLDPFGEGWAERTEALRAELDRIGLRVVVETGTRYLLDPFTKHRPTLVDAEAESRLAFLRRAVQICALLHAECVSIWSGVLPAGTTPEEGWALLLDRMPALLAYAAEHGVKIAFEPEPGMLVETVADARRLRSELGDPENLGITVDLGHCVAVEPGGVEGALREAGELLINVQVDDMLPGVHEHLELGHGDLDLALALRTLADIGYRGVAAVELPRHSHDAPGLAERSMAAMSRAWKEAVTTPEHPWLTEARNTLETNPGRISLLFAGAGRGVGRTPIDPDNDPQGIRRGTVDDHARAELVTTLRNHLPAAGFAETVVELYRRGDDAERRGVLYGLNTAAAQGLAEEDPLVPAGREIVADALRTNDPRVVAASMGTFSGRHLDQYSWRHGVLKLIFMDVTLDVVDGLQERTDEELSRMAVAFAAERHAAGRPVPEDVHRLTTPPTEREEA
ncbi:sugar phosphate isomerase/epimerase [Nakamurella silvestris]|nr:sugar phosphate isomerase/epimerase [Nakamurella silvestris]